MEVGGFVSALGEIVDAIGVVAIVIGVLFALVDGLARLLRRNADVYDRFRRVLGRAILIGLELLVAADIIKTVAVTPTLESVTVLAIIVLVRTFLSWSLQLEVTGRWPWSPRPAAPAAAGTMTDGGNGTGAVPEGNGAGEAS
ncbi:DUF1622 domain-containing protein [Agromyces seonyuensis]|uniref:DUF1622 domain-containing protein n=1 Tax=Agromyces seonyuensis TaxID=2662446 RepID=A0A6I4NXZ9_9MICO|nr:DUF1622 domain-containing protein [Agromyces seonyuensis]MWB99128.1 DUF1622 domain-containing protein [Agromyces seonyuensis]